MRINSLSDAYAFYPNIDGFWDSDNLPETEALVRSSLRSNWATEWSSQSAERLTQLAHVLALQGKLSDAKATLDQVQQMMREATEKLNPRVELRWTLEQGRMHSLSMSPAKAHDLFVAGWRMAGELDEPFFAIDAALMLSIVKPPKFQNEWLKKALTLTEETSDEKSKLWLTHLLFLDGWHWFDFRHFESALESFEKALNHSEASETGSKEFALLWSKARTLRALVRTDEALIIQQFLLSEMTPTGKVNGHVYLELAECKQLLNSQDEAKGFFELAYAALAANSWYANNRSDELERMKYLYKKH